MARLNGTNPESIVATLKIDVKNERRASDNVIATTRWGDKNNVVFVVRNLSQAYRRKLRTLNRELTWTLCQQGLVLTTMECVSVPPPHLFWISVLTLPQSGTATVAELAKQIAKFKPGKNAVRFAWWTVGALPLPATL